VPRFWLALVVVVVLSAPSNERIYQDNNYYNRGSLYYKRFITNNNDNIHKLLYINQSRPSCCFNIPGSGISPFRYTALCLWFISCADKPRVVAYIPPRGQYASVKLKELKNPAGKGVSGKSCALYNVSNALHYIFTHWNNIILFIVAPYIHIESTEGKCIIIITPNRRQWNVIGFVSIGCEYIILLLPITYYRHGQVLFNASVVLSSQKVC